MSEGEVCRMFEQFKKLSKGGLRTLFTTAKSDNKDQYVHDIILILHDIRQVTCIIICMLHIYITMNTIINIFICNTYILLCKQPI